MITTTITKKQARSMVHYAIETGKLVRPDACPKCGYSGKPPLTNRTNPWTDEPMPDHIYTHPAVIAHHSDYQKPLQVDWMCQSCHTKLHRGQNETNMD